MTVEMPLTLNFDVQISDVSVGILVGAGISSCVAVASKLALVRYPIIRMHLAAKTVTGMEAFTIVAKSRFNPPMSAMWRILRPTRSRGR